MRLINDRLAIGLLCLIPAPLLAQDANQPIQSPRFSYEFRAGHFVPDLERYAVFYGDDRETMYAIGGSYRFKEWLEVGAELGHMSSKGVGLLTSSQELGGTVKYQLNPLQIYSNLILQRNPYQRAVPYLGLGLTAARYEQTVELQSDVEGTTDLGYAFRLGVRLWLGSNGTRSRPPGTGDPLWKSYLFIEASEFSTEVRDVDLGGRTYFLGFRMEFDLSR